MKNDNETLPDEHKLATFSERVLAFSADFALFGLGYLLSHGLVEASRGAPPPPGLWFALWGALFLIYQAYSSCEGRASLGKHLMGLRVVDADNEPLGLGAALMRSLTYMVSSVGSVGFLWSLMNPSRQCWHDMVVGSVVVVSRRRPMKAMRLVRAGAAACMLVFAGLWTWQRIEPSYTRIMTVANAHVGLAEMAELQKTYFMEHGVYADNIFALASASLVPDEFLAGMTRLFDPESGIDIEASGEAYRITARARDRSRTLVSIQGPA